MEPDPAFTSQETIPLQETVPVCKASVQTPVVTDPAYTHHCAVLATHNYRHYFAIGVQGTVINWLFFIKSGTGNLSTHVEGDGTKQNILESSFSDKHLSATFFYMSIRHSGTKTKFYLTESGTVNLLYSTGTYVRNKTRWFFTVFYFTGVQW